MLACVHLCKKESSFDLYNVRGFCVFVQRARFLRICAMCLTFLYLCKESGLVHLCKDSGFVFVYLCKGGLALCSCARILALCICARILACVYLCKGGLSLERDAAETEQGLSGGALEERRRQTRAEKLYFCVLQYT